MSWLSGSNKDNKESGSNQYFYGLFQKSPPQTLQLLSFEAAKTMSRLVSLYKFLSDHEFSKFRNGLMKSEGIRYLNSSDEGFLLNLACEEKLEELNSAAINVSRLGKKCSNSGLKHFDQVFAFLKQGIIGIGGKTEYNSGFAEKIVEKMGKYIAATLTLQSALEYLTELEVSERKLDLWKKNVCPKLAHRTNYTYLQEKLAFQRKQVKHYKEISLWCTTFDKGVGLMARIICIIYVRICDLFGCFVQSLPRLERSVPGHKEQHKKIHQQLYRCLFPDKQRYVPSPKRRHNKEVHQESDHCLLADKHKYVGQSSFKSDSNSKSHSQEQSAKKEIFDEGEISQQVIQSAPPSTVGSAGLALRYANIIIVAERCVQAPTDNEITRGILYEMLPTCLKAMVKVKLRSKWKIEKNRSDAQELVEKWWVELEERLGWLAPMARDTVQWDTERNLEKRGFDVKPTVLLLQTLFLSDLEKTKAAIVDVLAGLSCIYEYQKEQLCCGGRVQGWIRGINPTGAKREKFSPLERT